MEFLGINILKSIIIIAIILLYWKFIYYPYHKKPITPLTLLAGGVGFMIIGIYAYLSKKTPLPETNWIYFIIVLYLLIAFTLTIIGIKKQGLSNKIDILLTLIKDVFGLYFVYLSMVASFVVLFFATIGTQYLLGPEHVIVWVMIFIAWARSGYKLLTKQIMRHNP